MDSATTESMWRVAPLSAPGGSSVTASRVRLANAAGEPLSEVTSDGWHAMADTRLGAGPAGRRVVVAELPAWQRAFRVSVDGRTVAPRTTGDTTGYPVPAGSVHLRIEPLPTYERTRWVQLALLAIVCFGALPFGNRASRRRAW